MTKLLHSFLRDEEGATAIEYGLIAALIAVPIITYLPEIGERLKAAFKEIQDSLPAAPGTGVG